MSWCDDILRHAPTYRVNPDLLKALDEVLLEFSLIRGRGCGTVFVSPPPSFPGIPQRGNIPETPQEAMT